MDIAVARRAGGAAAQEALALPEARGIVREAARPAVGPVRRIAAARRLVFEDGLKIVVVVLPRPERRRDGFAQRVTLRANRAARRRIQSGRPHDVPLAGSVRRRRSGVLLDVRAPGAMTALAPGPAIRPPRPMR